jgi:hypothetical protein
MRDNYIKKSSRVRYNIIYAMKILLPLQPWQELTQAST